MTKYSILFLFSLILFFVSLLQTGIAKEPTSKSYLTKLLTLAKEKKLSEKRYWQVLLHYKQSGSGWKSEVDNEEFFLSEEGQNSPESELIGTITKLLQSKEDKPDNHPQCRFPARFAWLDQQLDFDRNQMEVLQCSDFQKWKSKIDGHSVSLVFAGYYLNSPASMFGHTFLRIDSKRSKHHPLLGYAVNFSAKAEGSLFLPVYMYRGLFGGYRGIFGNAPYYKLVKSYTDLSHRDLWEYDMNFTKEEVQRLIFHLWELSQASLDYYFFDENCSYHVLSLLEAARPSLHLQESFYSWVIPVDTIKTVLENEGLLKKRQYRPSRWSKFAHLISLLDPKERELLKTMIDRDPDNFPPDWQSLTLEKQALLLSCLNEYYMISNDEVSKKRRDRVLRYRAKRKITAKIPKIVPPDSPEVGHDSFMMGISVGDSSELGEFMDVRFRFSLHDLMANHRGYSSTSEVETGRFHWRKWKKQDQIRVEEYHLLRIISIHPYSGFHFRPSWKMDWGGKRLEEEDKTDTLAHYFEFGAGSAMPLLDGTIYSFLNLRYQSDGSDLFTSDLQLGYLSPIFKNWKLGAELNRSLTDQTDSAMATLAWYVTKNSELRLTGKTTTDNQETALALLAYF